jgi:peptide-methionine (S)-S-oxide reductase
MKQERAVLAGGCFWGMQDLIRRLAGVISTRVGYTGGDVPNATYRNHGTHAEAIEIIFDPSKISYRRLLEFFFQIHDPTTKNRQGNDVGLSYRSAIFYTSDEQKRIAEATIADVEASGLWPGKVVTRFLRLERSGTLSPSTRIIWNAFHMATPATSFARTGNYPPERKVGREPRSSFRELTRLAIQY